MSVTIDQMRRDLRQFSQSSISVDLTFTPPSGDPVTIIGFGTAHHLNFDPATGRPINSKNAHCSFSEKLLTDAGYPVRVNDEVRMTKHQVLFEDSAGIERKYLINKTFPDETFGMIVCILGEIK